MAVVLRHVPDARVGDRGAYLWVSRRYLRAKRIFDLLFSLAVLVPVALVGLLCAVAIKLESPGPVMFSQLRTGRDGRPFRMYKFRTMVANAEELKASLAHLNVLPPPDFKIPNDPRVTRVGAFLRRTSLDELPQLLNVLKGEMSIVGPRPTTIRLNSYDLWHCERLEVPPGITGLWQLDGRNSTSFDERLRLDIKYIESMSLLQYVKLVLRTVAAVVKGTGA
ncbi:MAG: sugar transferase [Chloroflexota bacterium]|nr:sugar transferase [Chloroflexota bacterium]